MNKIKTIVLAATFAVFGLFSANAIEFSAGISLKGVELNGDGSESTSTQTRSETVQAAVGEIFAEARYNMISVGVGVIPYSIESETTSNVRGTNLTDQGTTKVQVDLENNYSAYVLLHLGDSGVYLKGMGTISDVITNESMATGSKYGNDELQGTHLGIGYEHELDTVSVRVEAMVSDYEAIDKQIDSLKVEIQQTDNLKECERIQERITRLASGVAVIRVGASTEVEMIEKKHRVEDALEAVSSAQKEGIIPGGSSCLLRIAKKLIVEAENKEQELGIEIVKQAVREPFKKMVSNAGLSPDIFVEKIENQIEKYDFAI